VIHFNERNIQFSESSGNPVTDFLSDFFYLQCSNTSFVDLFVKDNVCKVGRTLNTPNPKLGEVCGSLLHSPGIWGGRHVNKHTDCKDIGNDAASIIMIIIIN